MKLGEQGEAFFVVENTTDEEISPSCATSPLPTSPSDSRPTTPLKSGPSGQIVQVQSNGAIKTGPTARKLLTSRKKKLRKREIRNSIKSDSEDEINELDLEFDPEL